MKILFKVPGHHSQVIDAPTNDKNLFVRYAKTLIYDNPDFRMFDKDRKIGMYVSDNGYGCKDKNNFVWNHIVIQGNVVFVAIDNDEKFKDLSDRQIKTINEYLSRNSTK